MPISEMKQGVTAGGKGTPRWEEFYREIHHMEVCSPESEEMGMIGYVSLGVRDVDHHIPPEGEGMVVLKTCESETAFSCNRTSGENERGGLAGLSP